MRQSQVAFRGQLSQEVCARMQLARWVNYEPALGQAVRAKEGEDAPSAVGRGAGHGADASD